MKYIKLFSLLCVVLLTTVSINFAAEYIDAKNVSSEKDSISSNKVLDDKDNKADKDTETSTKKEIPKTKILTEKDLEVVFPDENFRNVVTRHFKNEEITLNKIGSLSGELYATGEHIENLTGISNLTGIETFIFWNNNIKTIPEEILKLDKVKSINLANNLLIDESVVDEMKHNGVDINYDLNFIKNEKNQYSLFSYKDQITLKVGQELDLSRVVYRNIDNYPNYWEILMQMPEGITYDTHITNKNIISCDGAKIKALSKGNSEISISIDDSNNPESSTCLNVEVK